MSGQKDDMLEVDDNFGLDESGDDDDEFALQDGDDGQQVMNFGQDDQQDDDDDEFGQQDDQDEDQDDIPDDDDDDQDGQAAQNDQYNRQDFHFGNTGQETNAGKNEDLNTKKVENEQFDEALEVDDSNEIESDDDENEPNANADAQTNAAQANAENEDDDQELPGQYNAADYANLNVSAEVRELFEYIGRYKPQKIDLETTFKPFIPEYMP